MSRLIVGRCVHNYQPITCTGMCDTELCPLPWWQAAGMGMTNSASSRLPELAGLWDSAGSEPVAVNQAAADVDR